MHGSMLTTVSGGAYAGSDAKCKLGDAVTLSREVVVQQLQQLNNCHHHQLASMGEVPTTSLLTLGTCSSEP